jgi:glycosyltransferase involved in cell wall biosynthesis
MACGTSFVASNVGGIPEIASSEHDLLVSPGDPKALADAIRERLETPVSSSPRAFMAEDWPTAASRLIDVIWPLLKKTEQSERTESETDTACLTPSIV